jgi:hypothetical protein
MAIRHTEPRAEKRSSSGASRIPRVSETRSLPIRFVIVRNRTKRAMASARPAIGSIFGVPEKRLRFRNDHAVIPGRGSGSCGCDRAPCPRPCSRPGDATGQLMIGPIPRSRSRIDSRASISFSVVKSGPARRSPSTRHSAAIKPLKRDKAGLGLGMILMQQLPIANDRRCCRLIMRDHLSDNQSLAVLRAHKRARRCRLVDHAQQSRFDE